MNNEFTIGSTVVCKNVNSLADIAQGQILDSLYFELDKAIQLRKSFVTILDSMEVDAIVERKEISLSVEELMEGLMFGDQDTVNLAVENFRSIVS